MCCYIHVANEHSAVCAQLNRAYDDNLDKQV